MATYRESIFWAESKGLNVKELFMMYGKYKAEESGQRLGWRGRRGKRKPRVT